MVINVFFTLFFGRVNWKGILTVVVHRKVFVSDVKRILAKRRITNFLRANNKCKLTIIRKQVAGKIKAVVFSFHGSALLRLC